jgi:predicted amidohydrolase
MRIAMAQMLVEGGRLDANLARARERIAQAAESGADVVVLPECCDLGWLDESGRELARPIPGATVEAFAAAARQHRIVVVAGLTERAGDQLHNAAVVIDRDGRVLRHHRKINELDFARAVYAVGDSLAVVDSSIGRIGLAICADLSLFTPGIGAALGTMRAQIILSPTAWAVPPYHDNGVEPYGGGWRTSYTEIARTFGIAVIGVSNVGLVRHGPWAGWRCIGCSLAIGPGGQALAQGRYGADADELLCVETTLPKVQVAHW